MPPIFLENRIIWYRLILPWKSSWKPFTKSLAMLENLARIMRGSGCFIPHWRFAAHRKNDLGMNHFEVMENRAFQKWSSLDRWKSKEAVHCFMHLSDLPAT